MRTNAPMNKLMQQKETPNAMNSMVKAAAAALCLTIAAIGTANASEPYVGAGFGAFKLGNGVDKKSVGGGFLKIGDDFSEYLGAELRLGLSGKTGEELTLQSRNKIDYFAAAFLKPLYRVNDNLTGYGLIGLATLRGSYSQGTSATQKKTRTGYAYGAGLQYLLSDNYAIDLGFSHMLSKPKTTTTAIKTNFKGLEASLFTLSINYYLF